MAANKLILGDNLDVMQGLESESVDLIYLDPPFFSNRNYEVIWGDDGEVRSFQDRWEGGVEHYIGWLKERVLEMHRVLKPTGSLFLHCDWHASHYIKVEILDRLFGMNNFCGEIAWQRTNAHSDAKRKLAVLKDSIFYYTKSAQCTYNPVYTALTEKYEAGFYKYDDNDGRGTYRLSDMAAPYGGGMSAILPETGKPRGWYVYKGYEPPKTGWRYSLETMQQLDRDGKIYFPKNKSSRLRLKRYLSETQGVLVGDVWTDIPNIQSSSKERIGYPTQKPEALLERIIAMASNEGDTVLDPFCGGGTTIVTADKLKRKWIGIDQSVAAVKVTDLRLKRQQDLYSQPYDLLLRMYDFDALRTQNEFEFERMMVEKIGGIPNAKQRGDLGIDGRMPNGTPIQIKRKDKVGRNEIDNFVAAIQRYDKQLFEKNRKAGNVAGVMVAFSFGKGLVEEAARLKNAENTIIELKRVDEIVDYAKAPKVQLSASELAQSHYALEASAESEAGIEFFSWDFEHNPQQGFRADVMFDKVGKQVRKFAPGEHQVAVGAVDTRGLTGTDKIKVKVKKK